MDTPSDTKTIEANQAGNRGRILVVDDSRLVRVMLSQYLGGVGFQVDQADSGVGALGMLTEREYDVVITDLQMPGVDGFEVLAAAKRLPQGVEVIVLTGAHGQDMSAPIRALRMGAHDYLTKPPPSADEVVLIVERAMEKIQLRKLNRQLLERLETQSLTDTLTNTPNRRAFEQALPKEIARARRQNQTLGLIALDIDHFKRVNDLYGHQGGDQVLCGFSSTVAAVLRRGDTLYRTGGEEFVVILSGADTTAAMNVGRRIVEAVAASPVDLGDRLVTITTSAGAACLEPGGDGRDVWTRADEALYQAKKEGRNRVCLAEIRAVGTAST